MGSLSTPPCTEGVYHFVMADPIYVSPSQMFMFSESAYNYKVEPLGNARQVQNVGLRSVYYREAEEQCAGLLNKPFDPRAPETADPEDVM